MKTNWLGPNRLTKRSANSKQVQENCIIKDESAERSGDLRITLADL